MVGSWDYQMAASYHTIGEALTMQQARRAVASLGGPDAGVRVWGHKPGGAALTHLAVQAHKAKMRHSGARSNLLWMLPRSGPLLQWVRQPLQCSTKQLGYRTRDWPAHHRCSGQHSAIPASPPLYRAFSNRGLWWALVDYSSPLKMQCDGAKSKPTWMQQRSETHYSWVQQALRCSVKPLGSRTRAWLAHQHCHGQLSMAEPVPPQQLASFNRDLCWAAEVSNSHLKMRHVGAKSKPLWMQLPNEIRSSRV
mmetsp:Transcript_16310/g.29666  ORF Transcript_16310/g.29666 Transcript_16310/m.29666 type:complete len:251 (+) Transcript_16310:522-1274(+)